MDNIITTADVIMTVLFLWNGIKFPLKIELKFNFD